jgi:hypothetical protein
MCGAFMFEVKRTPQPAQGVDGARSSTFARVQVTGLHILFMNVIVLMKIM